MSLKKDAFVSVSLIGHAKVKTIKKEPSNKTPLKSNEPTILPEEYIVEKIMGKRFWNGRPQLLIKWFGYPDEESTWEPQENMGNCIELLTDFEVELHKKQMKQEALIKTERLETLSTSAKKQNKKTTSSTLHTREIDEANLLMKMDKLQIKASSLPLQRKLKQKVKLSPEIASKTKQDVKLSPEMDIKTSNTLSPLKRKGKEEIKVSPEMTSKTLNIVSPLKRKANQELTPELDNKSLNILSSPKRKAKQEFKAKRNHSRSYEHRSFLDLSSDSSDNDETIPVKQETQKPQKQRPQAGKTTGACSPCLSAVSKYNSLEFIKEQARKWRGKKGKQHQKLRDTPTSRPGKPMKPRNLDNSIDVVMKRLHCGTHNRQENMPSTTTTPKCEPNLDDNYSINRSGNKRERGETWRVSPRIKKYPYGLARGLPLDKVIHHFKMREKLFLYVNWQGMSITDVILLDDLIDIYPQQIIKYLESLVVVM
ncbi:chromo domain-containing protein rhino-like isoform X2 [Drosophila tropicalis]